MTRIDALLADYADNHRTRGNVACHFVGIPMIVFGGLSMLSAIALLRTPFFTVTAAELLIVLAMVEYVRLDLRLAVAMGMVAVFLDLVARGLGDWRIGAAAFVVGWVFQGIGHSVYEKRSPAFLRNLVHLVVGPIFLINEVLHVRRIQPMAEARG